MKSKRTLAILAVVTCCTVAVGLLAPAIAGDGHSHAAKAEGKSCCGCDKGEAKAIQAKASDLSEKAGKQCAKEAKSCGEKKSDAVMANWSEKSGKQCSKAGKSCGAKAMLASDSSCSKKSGSCGTKAVLAGGKSCCGAKACSQDQARNVAYCSGRSAKMEKYANKALHHINIAHKALEHGHADKAASHLAKAESLLTRHRNQVRVALRPAVANSHCPMSPSKEISNAHLVSVDKYRVFKGKGVAFCCPTMASKWDSLSAEQKQQKLDKIESIQTSESDESGKQAAMAMPE